MRTIVALLLLTAGACGNAPPAELFPGPAAPMVSTSSRPFAGVDAVKSALAKASITYAEFAVLETDAGPVFGFTVTPDAAQRLWKADRAIWTDLGASLIFCGEEKCLDAMRDHSGNATSATATIRKGAGLSLSEWASKRRESAPEYFQPDRKKTSRLQPEPQQQEPMWTSVLGEPLNASAVFVLPSTKSWTAPAYLAFGGWNECPDPETQVAFAAYLNRMLGAEVVGIRYDSIRFTLAKPPTTDEEAIRIAWESFLYCPDAVHQGATTLEGLAEYLMGSTSIDFWWD